MFTATLVTAPPNSAQTGPALATALTPDLVNALRNAWGGAEVRWLAPGEAAEFTLQALPDNADAVWHHLQAQRVDLILQPSDNRRKRLLLADMDSTMIRQECIDELADAAGVGACVAAITARAMNGEIDFEAALTARVALLRDLPEGVIAQVLARRITLMPGGPALVATMKAHGAHTALISGGFTSFTGPIAARLGFDEHHANTLLIHDGHLTGQVARPILGRAAKVAALERIAARLAITPADVLAVGDGANDLGMLGLAGTGVALHAKSVVQAQARHRVNFGDLTALLYLQGYAKTDFA